MRRSTPWSSRHSHMLPNAGQLIAVWGFSLILLLAELSAAQSSFDISQGQVCDTEACKERAKMILASMNQTKPKQHHKVTFDRPTVGQCLDSLATFSSWPPET
uniref:Putative secreted protein n=1 Tax=Ixodes ricinus TaxID=34613 RepID=A0A6B0UFP8_IXORI